MKSYKTSTGTFVYSDGTNFYEGACFSPASDSVYFNAIGELPSSTIENLAELSADVEDSTDFDNSITTISNIRALTSDELSREKASEIYHGLTGLN